MKKALKEALMEELRGADQAVTDTFEAVEKLAGSPEAQGRALKRWEAAQEIYNTLNLELHALVRT